MFNNLAEIAVKFEKLKELASKLAAFESSGLKKELEAFHARLVQCREGGQTVTAAKAIERVLQSGITQVESWVKAEEGEQRTDSAQIEALISSLSIISRNLKVKTKTATQEAEQKFSEDKVGQKTLQPESLANLTEAGSQSSIASAVSQKTVISEADVTLLKEQVQALETRLLEKGMLLVERGEGLRKSANQLRVGKAKLAKLSVTSPEIVEHVIRMHQLMEDLKLALQEAFVQPDTETSVATIERQQLHAENLKLKAGISEAQATIQKLLSEKEALINDLANELNQGEKLSAEVAELQNSLIAERNRTEMLAAENRGLYETNAMNMQVAKGINALRNHTEQEIEELAAEYEEEKRVSEQVFEQNRKMLKRNEDLTTVIEEENRRYLALEAESKAALDAKAKAEESAAFAHKSLDVATTELTTNVKARQTAESNLALRSAQLQRNLEDLKRLNADILELAEFAERLQTDKDKYYTESQYGYIRQKCDSLQRRRGELLQRVHTAEKSAKQAALEVGYRDSAQRGHIQKLEAEISQLKDKTLALQQEISVLKSSDVVLENNQLKAKLKAERDKKFTGVLENLDNAAVKGVIVLEKKNQEQKARIEELEAQLAAQIESAPVVQVNESRLAKNIKRFAIGAGFVLAGIATVAALGFLGVVAVTYALPLLAIGLVVAAGGTVIAKLIQSKHEDGIALEVAERREAQPGFVQKTALAVKTTLEKAVITVSSDMEKI